MPPLFIPLQPTPVLPLDIDQRTETIYMKSKCLRSYKNGMCKACKKKDLLKDGVCFSYTITRDNMKSSKITKSIAKSTHTPTTAPLVTTAVKVLCLRSFKNGKCKKCNVNNILLDGKCYLLIQRFTPVSTATSAIEHVVAKPKSDSMMFRVECLRSLKNGKCKACKKSDFLVNEKCYSQNGNPNLQVIKMPCLRLDKSGNCKACTSEDILIDTGCYKMVTSTTHITHKEKASLIEAPCLRTLKSGKCKACHVGYILVDGSCHQTFAYATDTSSTILPVSTTVSRATKRLPLTVNKPWRGFWASGGCHPMYPPNSDSPWFSTDDGTMIWGLPARLSYKNSSFCSEGCRFSFIGDGQCDEACLTEACDYDSYDCLRSCPKECDRDLIGDGTCNPECFMKECLNDRKDCEAYCSPGCLKKWLGDSFCDREQCNNKACEFDKGDCGTIKRDELLNKSRSLPFCAPGCDPSLLKNGVCDKHCFNDACNNDEGDCNNYCAPSCKEVYLGNERCDEHCNNSYCGFDHLDCGIPCKASEAFSLDANRDPITHNKICKNKLSWRYIARGREYDCDWVALRPSKRCSLVGKRLSAQEACPESCGLCSNSKTQIKDKGEEICKDKEWSKAGRPALGCDWVNENKEKRCDATNDANVPAKKLCIETCGTCESFSAEETFKDPSKNCKTMAVREGGKCRKCMPGFALTVEGYCQ